MNDREVAGELMKIRMLEMFLKDPRRLGMTEAKQKAVIEKIESVETDPNAQNTLSGIEQKVKEKRAAKIE